MAFVVEDGTGLVNSNSYGSIAEFTAYWLELNKDMSQYVTVQKQAALVASAQHIDLFFGEDFFGYKSTSEQAMEFPRVCLYDSRCTLITGVPAKVKMAQFEYAYRILSNHADLVPDPVADPTGLQVQATFEKVGPIEERITYVGGSVDLVPAYPKADAFLKEFLGGNGGGSHRA